MIAGVSSFPDKSSTCDGMAQGTATIALPMTPQSSGSGDTQEPSSTGAIRKPLFSKCLLLSPGDKIFLSNFWRKGYNVLEILSELNKTFFPSTIDPSTLCANKLPHASIPSRVGFWLAFQNVLTLMFSFGYRVGYTQIIFFA